MEGACPAAELWPGSGLQRQEKAAALESYLDGIKILLWPRKKSEAFGRRRQSHQRVRRRLLGAHLGSGDWAELGDLGRSGLARAEKPRTRENPGRRGEKNDCVVCTQ